jgi:hypothetical protein
MIYSPAVTGAPFRCKVDRMSTPSERIFTQLEDDDGTELRDIMPPLPRNPMTLAHTADRIVGGVALREAVADFVDDLRWARDNDDVAQRITERPRDLDPRTNVYLGALAEHVAAECGLTAPPWSGESSRFLTPDLVAAPSRAVGPCHRGAACGVSSAGHPAGRRNAEPGVAMHRRPAVPFLGWDGAHR